MLDGIERDRQADDICVCARLGPGMEWLCPVTRCYASSATGVRCEERVGQAPGQAECQCVAGIAEPVHCSGSQSRHKPRREYAGMWPEEGGISFKWLHKPPPGGWYGTGFRPEEAADTLSSKGLRWAEDFQLRHFLGHRIPTPIPAGQLRHRLLKACPTFGL